MMNILYVSCLCSDPKMHELFDTAKEKPHPAPQKYHSMMVKGFVANGCNVTCLVALPVTTRTHPHKKIWGRDEEIVDGVRYVYIPFYNSPCLKLFGFKIYAFFFTLIWSLKTREDKAMVCDVLNTHAAAAMRACMLTGVKSVGVVTDIPGMMVGQKEASPIRRYLIRKGLKDIRRMTHLVLLTDAMCDLINPERKTPYIVVEGMVDYGMKSKEPSLQQDGKRHITYTGTLETRYGVKTMIEAFIMLKQQDIMLDVYGNGPLAEEMSDYMNRDARICYHGVVPIENAVAAQRASYLLVNPRPTKEEFTKYSFPSKNMEYMATGVPLLTAVLPGMPKEYHPYVFLFEDETTEGICRKMDEILSMSEEDVRERGKMGKCFVMENKNNICQAKRVIELINNNKI